MTRPTRTGRSRQTSRLDLGVRTRSGRGIAAATAWARIAVAWRSLGRRCLGRRRHRRGRRTALVRAGVATTRRCGGLHWSNGRWRDLGCRWRRGRGFDRVHGLRRPRRGRYATGLTAGMRGHRRSRPRCLAAEGRSGRAGSARRGPRDLAGCRRLGRIDRSVGVSGGAERRRLVVVHDAGCRRLLTGHIGAKGSWRGRRRSRRRFAR